MNVSQLRVLRAIALIGSLTGAADQLGITQSAVSHALASLESEFSLRLVVRDRSGCTLTHVGERLLPYATEAVRAVDQFEEEAIVAAAGPMSGRLLVGTFPSVGRLLRPLVRSFGRRHPAVEVVLLEGTDVEVEHWLDSQAIDVATMTGARTGLKSVPFISDSFVAVLSAGHPLADEADVSLADLADDPFLLSDGGCERQIRQLYEEQGLQLLPMYRVQAIPTLLAMIGQDIGISVLPELALGQPDKGIAAVPLRPSARRDLLLAARADLEFSSAAQAFLDTVGTGSSA
jgi:DNA-binding transcriptional LysR family regulator